MAIDEWLVADVATGDPVGRGSVFDAEGQRIGAVENGCVHLEGDPGAGPWSITADGFCTAVIDPSTPLSWLALMPRRPLLFTDRLGCRAGAAVHLHVHAPEGGTLELVRYGARMRHVADWGDLEPSEKPPLVGDPVAEGCPWAAAAERMLPDDLESGLYGVRLHSAGGTVVAPFVVSPAADAPRQSLLVLASTTTWVSYNAFGGRSRYRNFQPGSAGSAWTPPSWSARLKARLKAAVPMDWRHRLRAWARRPAPDPAWQYAPLSLHRPLTNHGLIGEDPESVFCNHLAASEWRLLAWLEREGIPYDLATCHDLHDDPQLLHGYRGVVLSSHCEYWSGEMFEHLRTAHEERGLWVVNASGNTCFRQIEMVDERTQRCVDRSFAHGYGDETRVFGVRFTESGYGTAAPFRVRDRDHWIFDGFMGELAEDGTFGHRCLNRAPDVLPAGYDPGCLALAGEGASGWECDKRSATARDDVLVVAKGCNPRGSGSDMVVSDPAGTRGGLFSASSITYPGSLLVDPVCAGILRNVLRRACGTPEGDTLTG